jgi:hypothetical protein
MKRPEHISRPPPGETERCEADRSARPKRSEERARARDARASDVRREAPAARWSQPARVSRCALVLATLLAAAAAGTARGAPSPGDGPDGVSTYAIVVGSNPGGAGQTTLQFAEDDARRVADVLGDLGGYDKQHIALVLHPAPADVMTAIAHVADSVAADRAAGRRSVVFFYYSGHAKASALELGTGELPLADLREKIVALPDTLTVVVLDACQSGAFSRVKGAEPAADFSFNSRAKLDASGIAVMASSSASELSQESDLLKSSYFTHHLLVGLRGAGDANGDGRVSLDEAYQYAYHQTLLATAQTAVGEQHVSLEVDLKGQGEVALTYPARATARIELRAELTGDVVVEKLPAQAVIAEIAKAKGGAVRVAVAPGEYRVLVHHDHVIDRCTLDVATGDTGELGACDTIAEIATAAKGPNDVPDTSADLALDLGFSHEDPFTQRLRDFGYQPDFLSVDSRFAITAVHRVHPFLSTGVEIGQISSARWTHSTDVGSQHYSYGVTTLNAMFRAGRQLDERFSVYAQAGAGIARGHDTLVEIDGTTSSDTHWTYDVAVTGGFTFSPLFAHGVGLTLRASYVHAPAITDLLGDVRETGGAFVGLGLEYRP